MPPRKKFRIVKHKKRKFCGNQYSKKENAAKKVGLEQEKASDSGESECDEDRVVGVDQTAEHSKFKSLPASVRKLKAQSSTSEDSSSEEETDLGGLEGFRFIDLSVLASVFESLRCPLCKQGHAVLEEDEKAKMGLASLLILKCTSSKCKFKKSFYTSSKVENSQAFEVNRRVVLATRNIGVGHQGLVKFCCVMNMLPPMNDNSFQDHVKAVRSACQTVAEKSMSKAADEVKTYYDAEEDGVYNIAISGDGTWRRRGFSSSYGVVTAMSTVTGQALDCEIMSEECRLCMPWRGKEASPEFQDWWEGHQHECHANFSGSSGAMDGAGLLTIFERSIEKHSARYVEFLGDGDSKAHKKLVEEAVYGEVVVEKLECVGHVQKRLGSRLRSLKKRQGKTPLEDRKSIGGQGRLTNSRIGKLQVYYGRAIRDNTHNIESMKKAVFAIWHHTKSTDGNPDHDLCPSGADSWCGFQRDLANGTSDYQHDHPIPEAVADAIYPTFEALSDDSLLSRCLHGGTQNQNEAINGMIWQRATKETHSTLPTVELATFLALAHFNDGSKALSCVLKELGIVPGTHCRNACAKLDQRRLSHSERKGPEEAKRRRKKLRNWKKGFSETLEAREGPTYGTGAF